MLSKISLFCGAVVIALETRVEWYFDASCENLDRSVLTDSSYSTCDEFEASEFDECDSYGDYDDCNTIQLDMCSASDYWSTFVGPIAAILRCTVVTGSPTKSPTDYDCDDSLMNGLETGIDCGGPDCDPCPPACTQYNCGANYTRIDNPATVTCAASPCTSEDLGTCCRQKALCSSYDGCYAGQVLISNAASTYCSTTVCDSDDRDICCTAAGNCENFSFCDNATQYLKSNPGNLLCDSEVCDSSDIWKCCEDKADCSEYTCDFAGKLTHRENVEDYYCALSECDDSDSNVCCTTRASCEAFICDTDRYLNKSDKDSQFCSGIACSDDSDWFYCCDKRAECKTTLYTYPCPTDGPNLDEDAYCAGNTCISPDDEQNCCPLYFCDNNACDLSVSVVNYTRLCVDRTCTLNDTQCCLDRMSCRSFTECSSMEIVNEHAYCADVECVSSDNSECCIPKANCTAFNNCNLTSHYVNVNASCAAQICKPTDAATCCINKASCSDYACEMNTQLQLFSNYCEKDECSSLDVDNCCVDRDNCMGFQYCDDLTSQYVNVTAHCANQICENEDAITCCINKASCSEYACNLETYTNQPLNYCAMDKCTSIDMGTCCLLRASCTGFQYCGEGQQLNDQARCKSDSCTEVDDIANCCVNLPACGSYSCNSTQILIQNASRTYCSSGECQAFDCCLDRDSCTGFQYCGEGQQLNKEAICKADFCTEVDDVANCCVGLPSCGSYSCNSTTEILIQNASRTYCSSGECQDDDCCLDRESCMGFQYCGEGQQLSDQARCKTDSCTEVDDVANCCVDLPSCGSYSCNSTQILIQNASRTYCSSGECQAFDCCVDRASCTGFQYCGEDQQLNNEAKCKADSCTEVDDVANCCVDVASCESYSCSSIEILIKNASRKYCTSDECQAVDCCEAKANCSTYECEICDQRVMGYCADTFCTSSDYDTCCRKVVPQFDDSKGVRMVWNVTLEGDISMSHHETITNTIAAYLNLPCIWVNGSYTSDDSTWKSTYEIFVSTEGNDNAGTELATELKKASTINSLKDDIAAKLGVSRSTISLSTVSLSSKTIGGSPESSSEGLSIGIIIVIAVGTVLIGGVIVLVYKHNQRQKRGLRVKQFIEM